jgi:hypothetical protein
LKERAIIFFGLVAMAVVFLSCRSFDSIADIYVAVSHMKNITMSGAIYFASKFPFLFCIQSSTIKTLAPVFQYFLS